MRQKRNGARSDSRDYPQNSRHHRRQNGSRDVFLFFRLEYHIIIVRVSYTQRCCPAIHAADFCRIFVGTMFAIVCDNSRLHLPLP